MGERERVLRKRTERAVVRRTLGVFDASLLVALSCGCGPRPFEDEFDCEDTVTQPDWCYEEILLPGIQGARLAFPIRLEDAAGGEALVVFHRGDDTDPPRVGDLQVSVVEWDHDTDAFEVRHGGFTAWRDTPDSSARVFPGVAGEAPRIIVAHTNSRPGVETITFVDGLPTVSASLPFVETDGLCGFGRRLVLSSAGGTPIVIAYEKVCDKDEEGWRLRQWMQDGGGWRAFGDAIELPPDVVRAGPRSLTLEAVADVDDDGHDDVVAFFDSPRPEESRIVTIRDSAPYAGSYRVENSAFGSAGYGAVPGFLSTNGDHWPDVITAVAGSYAISENRGDGTFGSADYVIVKGYPQWRPTDIAVDRHGKSSIWITVPDRGLSVVADAISGKVAPFYEFASATARGTPAPIGGGKLNDDKVSEIVLSTDLVGVDDTILLSRGE